MDSTIIVALIGLVGIVISAVITYSASTKNYANKLEVQIAVMNKQLDTFAKAIDEHNKLTQKIPVMENDIKTLYHRVDKLEEER